MESHFGRFVPVVCELKIDGSSIALTYDNGRLSWRPRVAMARQAKM